MSKLTIIRLDKAGINTALNDPTYVTNGSVPSTNAQFQARSIAQAGRSMGLRVLCRIVDADAAGALALLATDQGAFSGGPPDAYGAYPIAAGQPDCEFFLEPDQEMFAIANTTGVTIAVATSPWLPPRPYAEGGQ